MVWQDITLVILNFLFSVSLVNQVSHGFYNKKGYLSATTATITFLGLYATALTFWTLGLFLSSIICTFNGTMWAILLIQRIYYGKA